MWPAKVLNFIISDQQNPISLSTDFLTSPLQAPQSAFLHLGIEKIRQNEVISQDFILFL
jgi:hypothetical protein